MTLRGWPTSRSRVAFWALAGVALVLSHDLVWLAQTGPGDRLTAALRSAGHGYWAFASLGLLIIGVIAAVTAGLWLRRMRRRARDLGASVTGAPSEPYRTKALGAWFRLLAVVAIGFVIQENVEHGLSHHHLPALGALLGPEYPLALPVIAAITAVAALLAAVVTDAERRLLVAIRAALTQRLRRAPARLSRPPLRNHRRQLAPLAAAWAGRAPPGLLATRP